MADQKISELQLVVATGITPTGVYMPLYTPMMSPQNRRMSVPELFKSPPRLEVKDTSVAGAGEIATLTTSYGTASLRVGTGGQFIVGGDVAAVGGVSIVSDSSPLTLGATSDVKLYRDASGVVALRAGLNNPQGIRVYNSYTGSNNDYLQVRFNSNTAQIGSERAGAGTVRNLDLQASGVTRISIPASHNSAVSVSGSLNISGTFTGLTAPVAVAQTWNNATTDFTAVTVDIIPQNAGNNSNFIEFRSSGTSYGKLTQYGDFQASSFTPADLRTRVGSSGIKIGTTAQYTFVNDTSAASSAIAAGLTLGGSGVVRATDGFGNTGSFSARNFHATVFSIPDGTGVDINPASGAIQTWVLGASRTPTANNFQAGQSVTLLIDDGAAAYTVNWNTIGVSWLNSIVPALPSSGYGAVELFKVGSTVYGSAVGNFV